MAAPLVRFGFEPISEMRDTVRVMFRGTERRAVRKNEVCSARRLYHPPFFIRSSSPTLCSPLKLTISSETTLHTVFRSIRGGASTVPPFNRLYPNLVSRNFPWQS